MDKRIKVDRAQKYSPYYVRVKGKKRYFASEELAGAALEQLDRGKPQALMGPRAYAEWQQAMAILPPGTSLLHVAQQFVARNRVDWARKVSTAVDAYLAVRAADPALRPRYLYRMQLIMRWLKSVAGERPLASLNYGDVEQLCRSRGGAHRQQEARVHMSVLFGYCLRQRWLEVNPADGKVVTLAKPLAPTPEFMPVKAVETLLNHAWTHCIECIPAFALQLFCGIRSEEITRLDWAQVVLDTHVDIQPKVSKTGERRVIDWWPGNLTSWLKPLKREMGPVAPSNYYVRRSVAVKKAEVVMPHNGFRHSYATYAVAMHQNAARVALMLGHHDPHLIYRHYRGYATKSEGDAYFSVTNKQ